MRVLVTGASGFLGQELIYSIFCAPNGITELVLTDITKPPVPMSATGPISVGALAADISLPSTIATLLEEPVDVVYILHGIMSGVSEAHLGLGFNINLTATMLILNKLRCNNPGSPPLVIYASSGEVIGPHFLLPDPNQPITELTARNPLSSYGTHQLIVESMINDFSRRGLIDGRILRLPTVIPRYAAQDGDVFSFASDIIREPLNGRMAILPIADKRLKMFVCSIKCAVHNFRHAMTIPSAAFTPYMSRTIILPGTVVSIQNILDTLVELSPIGTHILNSVQEEMDLDLETIVSSWPSNYDFSRALTLGFWRDWGLVRAIKEYKETQFQEKLHR